VTSNTILNNDVIAEISTESYYSKVGIRRVTM